LYPYPAIYDIIAIDELLAFIGVGESQQKMINLLCSIIERGKGSLDMVKTAQLTPDCIDPRYADKIHITEQGIIEYDSNTALMIACHYLDNKTMRIFNSHGFLSRLKVCTWDADWTAKLDTIKSLGDKVDIDMRGYTLSDIREAFNYVNRMKFKRIQSPPASYINQCIDIVRDRVAGLESLQAGISPDEIVSGRLRGAIIREFAYTALLNQISRHGGIRQQYDGITYTDEDLDVVSRNMRVIINDSIRLSMTMKTTSDETEQVSSNTIDNIIINIVSKGDINSQELVFTLKKHLAISTATAYRKIKTLCEKHILVEKTDPKDSRARIIALRR